MGLVMVGLVEPSPKEEHLALYLEHSRHSLNTFFEMESVVAQPPTHSVAEEDIELLRLCLSLPRAMITA